VIQRPLHLNAPPLPLLPAADTPPREQLREAVLLFTLSSPIPTRCVRRRLFSMPSPWVYLVFLVLDLVSLICVSLGSSVRWSNSGKRLTESYKYIILLLGFFQVAGVDLLLIDPFLVLVLFVDLLCSLNSGEQKSQETGSWKASSSVVGWRFLVFSSST
jgi:hypothetical protein